MSIGTYAQLQDAIYKWLLKTTSDRVVTSAQVQNYISLCEAELNRELRVRELQESTNLTTVADQDYVTLPTDYKRTDSIYHTTAPIHIGNISTKAKLKEKYTTATGRPRDYTIYGTKVFFGPTPDAVYTIPLDYFKAIPALTDSNTTNTILTAYPDLYLYGSLKQAGMQLKDKESASMWGENYNAIIDRLKLADQQAKLAAGSRMQAKHPIGGCT